MNAPWPKFRTSIRPNTSVRPDAMMKISMPIARLATVSVAHVLVEPISGIIASASASGNSSGTMSRFSCGNGSADVRVMSVIARSASDEAIQLLNCGAKLDCFASLAMTKGKEPSLMRLQAQAEQALLQGDVLRKLCHRAAMRDLAVVHHEY